MGVRINQNVMAMNAYRSLGASEGQLAKSLERLASGYRINRAADDAAGLVISEGLRAQVGGLRTATRNAQDAVSVVQVAEGALQETHAILQRMRELAVQSASTGSSDQPSRDAAQTEVTQLKAELNRIAETTRFGEQRLLDGSYGLVNQVGGITLASTVDLTTNNRFVVSLESGGSTLGVEVVLAGGMVFDATVTGHDQLLEDQLNDGFQTAFQALYGNQSPFRAQITSFGTGFLYNVACSTNLSFALDDAASNNAAPALSFFFGGHTQGGNVLGRDFQVGAGTGAGDSINVKLSDMRVTALGVEDVDISSASLAGANIATVDAAITKVSTLRGNLGAYQNRFERTIANLSVTTENLSASESRIRDTDMAAEMMSFTRASILQQAGTAMLAQANAVPQTVLALLQG